MGQAQAALNEGRFRDADRLFHTVLELDPHAYLAQEGLANVAKARGMTDDTIRLYREALPLEPADRVGVIDQAIGDLYASQLKWDEAVTAYREAVARKAPTVASNYALGLALYKLRRFREAEVYLHEAERHLKDASDEFRTQKEQLLHLLLSEVYSALSYPRYAIGEAHAGINGKNDEVRKTAWKVEDRLDEPFHRLNLKVMGEYDKSLLTPYNTVVPINGRPQGDSPGLLTALELNLATSPSRRWSVGGQYSFAVNTYTADATFSTMVNAPKLWVSWWNLKNTEFKLFYEYSHTMLNSQFFLQTHGPQLSYRWFWDHRHELAVLYSLHRNYYPGDPPESPVNSRNQQSGLEHLAIIRASFTGPAPAVQPYLQYSFDGNLTEGQNLHALISTFEAGFSHSPFKAARLVLGVAYSHVGFPDSSQRRNDKVLQLHGTFDIPVTSRLTVALAAAYTSADSNLHDSFAYQHASVSGGLTYYLPF